MVDGCGENFKPFITNDFLELLFSTLSHTNRFVRETGYYVLGSLVSCGFSCEGYILIIFKLKFQFSRALLIDFLIVLSLFNYS